MTQKTYICTSIDGLVQERCNSIAKALELHYSCTKPARLSISRESRASYPFSLRAKTMQHTLNWNGNFWRQFRHWLHCCQNDINQCTQGWTVHQNDDISNSLYISSHYNRLNSWNMHMYHSAKYLYQPLSFFIIEPILCFFQSSLTLV